MSQRREIEDKHTVKCPKCGHEQVDPHKLPAQKYLRRGHCYNCGYAPKEDQ